MIAHGIARRYAQALLELAPERGGELASRLFDFAAVISENRDLGEVLRSPAFSDAERERVLGRLFDLLGVAEPLDRFLKLLIERRRIAALPSIAAAFQALVDERASRVRVEVTSARALASEERARLEARLASGLGMQVVVEARVDPALLAGVAVRVGGLVIDGSLRNQLTALGARLVSS
ncbi:MAG: ATP synthase F1 subunit delta [Deltaproteobacteria bacterium]|nr:ATP synthase F1 subunit delta [Deltaproteobacteria bacterium]